MQGHSFVGADQAFAEAFDDIKAHQMAMMAGMRAAYDSVMENLDPEKRPLAATADFMEVFGVLSITIGEDDKNGATLLFDPDHSLEERVIAEQFAL